jgi:hypothetical protein
MKNWFLSLFTFGFLVFLIGFVSITQDPAATAIIIGLFVMVVTGGLWLDSILKNQGGNK